jgi:hypothetical protein
MLLNCSVKNINKLILQITFKVIIIIKEVSCLWLSLNTKNNKKGKQK